MSNINQRQVQKLLQKLSPQQIQMIKLLELPPFSSNSASSRRSRKTPYWRKKPPRKTTSSKPKRFPSRNTSPRTIRRGTNITPTIIRRTTRNAPSTWTEGMSFHENLIEQLGFKNLSPREMTLGQYLIGSIDDDGYLRRSLSSIADDICVQPRNRDDRAGAGKRTESHPRTGAHGRRVA